VSDDATQYVAELKREIEAETLRVKALRSALDWSDSYRESAIESLVAFEMATAPIGDAPPVAVAMIRSDLARAIRSVRRAGQMLNKLGASTAQLSAALSALRNAAKTLPTDLPKPRRHP